MELVHFTHRDGRVETLRPTHALQMAAVLGARLVVAEDGFTARSEALTEAARQVRERYRCRTVRKELRRIGLIGVEGAHGGSPIAIACADAEVTRQMADLAAGR